MLCVNDDDVDKNGWTVMISVKEVPSETHSTIPQVSEVHPMNETMRSFWPYIPRVAKGKMGRMANTGDITNAWCTFVGCAFGMLWIMVGE